MIQLGKIFGLIYHSVCDDMVYNHTEYMRKWCANNRENVNARCRRYNKNNKEKRHVANLIYYQKHKERIKQKNKEYRKTENGRLVDLAHTHKRNRNLGFIKIIDNIYPNDIQIHWHHVDDDRVFPIPKDVHLKYLGNNHRAMANCWIEIHFDFRL